MSRESFQANKNSGHENPSEKESIYQRADRLAAFTEPWKETFLDIEWKMEEFDMSLAGNFNRAQGDLVKSLYETRNGDSSGITAEVILEEFVKIRPGLAHTVKKFKSQFVKEQP